MYLVGKSKDAEIQTLYWIGWKSEKPTQEGWYWAITDGGCVIVEAFYMTVDKLGHLQFRTGWNSIDESNVTQWLGPLPVPERPE